MGEKREQKEASSRWLEKKKGKNEHECDIWRE